MERLRPGPNDGEEPNREVISPPFLTSVTITLPERLAVIAEDLLKGRSLLVDSGVVEFEHRVY